MRRGKYSSRRGARRSKQPFIIGSIVLAALLALAAGAWWYLNREDDAPTASDSLSRQTGGSELAYDSIEGRYLFHGTIAWDRAIERDARGDFSRPFSLLNTFEREKYDAWIADLECPSTNTTVPYETQVNSLIFNCPTAFNAEAKKYFDILNLANNHTHDLGYEGFLETQKNLTEAGFQVYGSQDITDEENYCEVIDLPIRLKTAGKEDTQASLPIAFCAYHAVSRSPTAAELQIVADYAKIMPVFAFGHAGIEYTTTATEQQRTLARDLIDAGAEFVIMNHPHWVQDTDVYKDKLIVYSTGNFIYDQLTYEEMRSASYDIIMRAQYDQNIAAWIAYAKECSAKELHDSCYDNLPDSLQKPSFTYLYDMVAGDERPPQRWLARKADEELQLDTERRTNWTETLRRLGQTERLN